VGMRPRWSGGNASPLYPTWLRAAAGAGGSGAGADGRCVVSADMPIHAPAPQTDPYCESFAASWPSAVRRRLIRSASGLRQSTLGWDWRGNVPCSAFLRPNCGTRVSTMVALDSHGRVWISGRRWAVTSFEDKATLCIGYRRSRSHVADQPRHAGQRHSRKAAKPQQACPSTAMPHLKQPLCKGGAATAAGIRMHKPGAKVRKANFGASFDCVE